MNRYAKRFYLVYQGFIPSIILLGICLGAIFIGIVPLVSKFSPLYEENQKLASENTSLSYKLTLLNGLDEAELLGRFNETTAAIPGERLIPSVLSTLDAVALKHEVTVDTIDLGNVGGIASNSAGRNIEDKKLGVYTIPFTAGIIGTVEQQQQFLEESINVRRLFRITGFKLALNQQSAIETKYEIEAFFAPFPKVIGGVSQKLIDITPEENATYTLIQSLPIIALQYGMNQDLPAANVLEKGRDDPFSF